MAEKNTDPWSPAAHHGIARNTMKNLGETRFRHMVAQAETVICIGSIFVTCEILWFSENLQKPLVKQGFEQEHQMAEKRQTVLPSPRSISRHVRY